MTHNHSTNFTDKTHSQFSNDYTNLHNDAKAFNTACENLKSLKELFNSVWSTIIKEVGSIKKHPGEALVLLTVLFFGKAMDNYYSQKMDIEAKEVKVQDDMTKLTNDLQNIVNNNGSVSSELKGATELQNLLSGKGPSWGKYVQKALGNQASTYLSKNYGNIASTIHQYFMGAGTLKNFETMHSDLQKQNETDAQDANKAFTNAYNQNISATQSLGQAASTEIGLITSKIKTNTTTTSDLIQDFLTLARTAIKNQTPQ